MPISNFSAPCASDFKLKKINPRVMFYMEVPTLNFMSSVNRNVRFSKAVHLRG
jgi:hypothetical protein